MTSYIYSEPERYGLSVVGEVDWTDGCYQFDLTVVWRDTITGEVFYGQDSGCSCPSPFEEIEREALTGISKPQDLIDHIERYYVQQMKEEFRDEEQLQRAKADAGQLVMKTRVALDNTITSGTREETR